MMTTLARGRRSVLVVLTAAAVAAASWLGCDGYDRGALDDEEEVGRQERGRDPGSYWGSYETDEEGNVTAWEYYLFYSDVILSPDGLNLLAMVPVPGPDQGYDAPGLVLVVQPLPFGIPRVFPEVKDITRLNFSPSGDRAYAIEKGGGTLSIINLRSYEVEEAVDLPGTFFVVDVTPDGAYAVVSNLPVGDWAENLYSPSMQGCVTTYWENGSKSYNACQFAIIDLATGKIKTHTLPYRLRDIDFSPVGGEILFTYSYYEETETLFLPHAVIEFYSPKLNQFLAKTDFPNCADELVLEPSRNMALLSPTTCGVLDKNHDPISVIDLEKREFVKNLPGFGPVVISDDGSKAVGFTRRENMELDWNYQGQTTAIGLIFVDLDTLGWKVMDYGPDVPTYTLSPDGSRLFVYAETDGDTYKPRGRPTGTMDPSKGIIQVLLDDLSWSTIAQSSKLAIDHFVWTEDGSTMFFFSDTALFRLDAATGAITPVPIYGTPRLMNLRPQQDFLVLGEAFEPTFYLLDLHDGMKQTSLPLNVPTLP
jgi:hypothetical protein